MNLSSGRKLLLCRANFGLQFTKFTRSNKSLSVIDVPFSRGQPKLGVEKGPQAIRSTNVLKDLKSAGYTIFHLSLEQSTLVDDHSSTYLSSEGNVKAAKNINSVAKMAQVLSQIVEKQVKTSQKTIVLGGDHSIALGSITGHARAKGDICVIWIDAHADINTISSSTSGNMHGMPVSFLLHELNNKRNHEKDKQLKWLQPVISSNNFAYIGLRDIDSSEDELMTSLNCPILSFTASQVRSLGPKEVINRVLSHINPHGDKNIHVSFDIDSLDPSVAPSTGTPVAGGLILEDAHVIGSVVKRTKMLTLFDLVEVNPDIGSTTDVLLTKMTAKDVIHSFFIGDN